MNLTELKRAIQNGRIDLESSEWIDFVFELLKQEPDADEVRLGNLLYSEGIDSSTVKTALDDFRELKTLITACP